MRIKILSVLVLMLLAGVTLGCLQIEPKEGKTQTDPISAFFNYIGDKLLGKTVPEINQSDVRGGSNRGSGGGSPAAAVKQKEFPDISIQSLEVPTNATYAFTVKVNLQEVDGTSGATFNVTLKESDNILSSKSTEILAGGTASLSFPLILTKPGVHNLTAIVENSNPSEKKTSNNFKNFSIKIIKPLINPENYSTMYYYQVEEYNNRKSFNSASDGGTHLEVSEINKSTVEEMVNYRMLIYKELVFPLDYLLIRISSESGLKEQYELSYLDAVKFENGNSIFSIYIPDKESNITIRSGNGATEIKLEKKYLSVNTISSGYNYYTDLNNESWSKTTFNEVGTLIRPLISNTLYIEFVHNGTGYGGNQTTDIPSPSFVSTPNNAPGNSGFTNITRYYITKNGITTV